MAKTQANAKQHPEAELLPFENYHPRYHREIMGRILKNNHNENEDKNKKRSHRYDINRPLTIFIIF